MQNYSSRNSKSKTSEEGKIQESSSKSVAGPKEADPVEVDVRITRNKHRFDELSAELSKSKRTSTRSAPLSTDPDPSFLK